MGDFESDKGRRQAEHLIWSRHSPYARHLQGRYTPVAPVVRPLPGASCCEGPINTRIAAVPFNDPHLPGWNPSAPVVPFFSVEDVSFVEPGVEEGYFLNRAGLGPDFPPPTLPLLQGNRLAREPALEDDPDSDIEVPMHHNARLLRADDNRQSNIVFQFFDSMFGSDPWPPPPATLSDEPGYAREPCHARIDCCESPEDPATVVPTWLFDGPFQAFDLIYRTGDSVMPLESMAYAYTPQEWDDGTFNPDILLVYRPGFDERDPVFMEDHSGNIIRIPPGEMVVGGLLASILNNFGDAEEFMLAQENEGRFDWALDGNRVKHSMYFNTVFVQNHETDHVDFLLRDPTIPFQIETDPDPELPDIFNYSPDWTRSESTTISPFSNQGWSDSNWVLKMHLYRPRMRWWPYDAIDSGGGAENFWRIEVDLDIDADNNVTYYFELEWNQMGWPAYSYNTGFQFHGDLTTSGWSDLLDTIIAYVNDNSEFIITRQPDEGGKAILHITHADAEWWPLTEFDLLSHYLELNGDNLYQVPSSGTNQAPYTSPIDFSPKNWCLDAVEEVKTVTIAGPGISDAPAINEGRLQFIDLWGNAMPVEWFDGDEREIGGTGGGVGPYRDELRVARIRVPITIPAGAWAIGFSWEWDEMWDDFPGPAFKLSYLFIPDQGPRCIPWMTPTGGSDCALGSLPPLD